MFSTTGIGTAPSIAARSSVTGPLTRMFGTAAVAAGLLIPLSANAAGPAVKAMLVDARSHQVIGSLTQGATVNLAAASGKVQIRIVRTRSVRSVSVVLDGHRVGVRNRRALQIKPGAHTLKITSITGRKARRISRHATKISFTAVKSAVTTGSTGTTATGQRPSPRGPLAARAQWEANMISYGRKFCDPAQIASLATWEGNVWYYDGTRVFTQIGDYTKDASWYKCASYVRDLYRGYVFSGKTPGWRVFPHGLAEDYLRNNDAQSREAVRRLAQESAFASAGGGASHELSRETAYIINAYIKGEDVGFGRSPMLATAVNNALGHLDQWTGSKSAPFVKPFMMALTFEALIGYYDHTGDPRILPAIQHAADWLWDNMWDSNLQAFPYILCRAATTNTECSVDHTGEGADLNNLIAPVFGWLYQKTGDAKYIDRGDMIFTSGVKNAWLNQGKQFSQNYRWSFKYLEWRDGR